MIAKREERLEAIKLRKQGLSYSEILSTMNVSKSTLSLWLRNIELDGSAKSKLRNKLERAQKLGAEAKHRQRIEKVRHIEKVAISEIPDISSQELFLMGIMLYWGEGAKSRGKNISPRVDFTNSDPIMCKFFMRWLRDSLKVEDTNITPCIYIHESRVNLTEKALNYWSSQIGFPKEKFGRTCFTKTIYPRKNKRLSIVEYHGQLRIRVRKSTDLNRKIAGWIKGISIKTGVASQNVL